MEKVHKLFDALEGYKIEAILLSMAFLISLISVGVYIAERNKSDVRANVTIEPPKEKPRLIMIDIEGAVHKPGVYALPENSRLKDALESSQGLSEEADLLHFFRNFNQARILSDQEKIYIPTPWEILNDNFAQDTENQKIKDQESNLLININDASEKELEELPAVGKVTAEKIMEGRPYGSIEELSEKKIIGESTFEKIKDLITTN